MIGLLVFTVDKFRLVLKIIDFLLHDVFFVNLLLCNSISSVTKSLFMWCFKMFRSALEVFFSRIDTWSWTLHPPPITMCDFYDFGLTFLPIILRAFWRVYKKCHQIWMMQNSFLHHLFSWHFLESGYLSFSTHQKALKIICTGKKWDQNRENHT